jgi:hypothetical protein
MFPDYNPTGPETRDDLDAVLLSLPLDEVEEAAGEIHRRIAAALRGLGEQAADVAPPGQRSPRWQVAALVASTEVAAQTLGAVAAGGESAVVPRIDRHAATIAAVMYAAPSIQSLLARLEQDRRLLVSLARTLAETLDERRQTAWGMLPLRELVTQVIVLEAARCAVALEQVEPPA